MNSRVSAVVVRRAVGLLFLLASTLALPVTSVVADSPWDVPVAPVNLSEHLDDPLWVKARAEGLAREAARKQELVTPAARERREDSQTAFEDVSRSEATELAQQTFPDLLAAPVDDLGLPGGVHLDKFLSPDVARLTNSLGKHSLLIGSDPLAVPDADGHLEAIDLSLSSEQGKLVPDNPAADVALPDSAGDALQLPDQNINISADAAADVAGEVQDDRVFYPEVSVDTDYITMARADGAQVMWQLRSAQATESPSLHLDLPAGAHARLTSMLTGAPSASDPSVEIVKDDGAVVSIIQAPVVKDADGTSVPAAYRLDGDTLIVDVAHRDKDLHYPILVDPEVHEVWGGSDWDNFGKGTCNCNAAGLWGMTVNGSGFAPYNSTWLGRGLFIASVPGFYYAGQWAELTWGTPPYVNIMSAWFDGLYHVTQGDHLVAGTWGQGGWTSLVNIVGDTNYSQYTAIPNVPWENAQAVLGVWEDQTVQHPIWGWAGVRGVNIRVGDTRPPDVVQLDSLRVNGVTQPALQGGKTPWLNSASTVTARVYAHDLGLGLQHVGLMTSDNNWFGSGTLHTGCSGNRSGPCPPWSYADVTVPAATGSYSVRTVGIDITDNPTFGPPFTIRRDGQQPLIVFGGEVWDHLTDGTLGYNPTLNVQVTDGNPASTNDHQSGYSRFSVNVDGNIVYTYNNPNTGDCTDCAVSQNVTLPITTPGAHTVLVYAVDKAGNAAQTSAYTAMIGNYPTSVQYGGSNYRVDTPAEINSVVTLLQAASDDDANQIWVGLTPDDALVVYSALAEDPAPQACAGTGTGPFACTGEITGGADFPATSYAVNAGNCGRYSSSSFPHQSVKDDVYPSIWSWEQSWKLWTQVPNGFGPPLPEIISIINHKAKIAFNGTGVTVTVGADLLCGPGLKFVTSVKFTAVDDRAGTRVTDVKNLSSSGYVLTFSKSYATVLHRDRYLITFSNTVYEKEGVVVTRHTGPSATSYTIRCGENGSGSRVCWFEL